MAQVKTRAQQKKNELDVTPTECKHAEAEHVLLPHHPKADTTKWPKIYKLLKQMPKTAEEVCELLEKVRNPELVAKSSGVAKFMSMEAKDSERELLFKHTLPFIQQLVLDLPKVFPTACVLLMPSMKTGSVDFTERECAVLLACSFFSLHPLLPPKVARSYPTCNFYVLLSAGFAHNFAKYRCLLQYFDTLRTRGFREPARVMTLHRHCLTPAHILRFTDAALAVDETKLCTFSVHDDGTIEDDGVGMIQADFANSFIGGGVLEAGCVQEEIRFSVNPECLVSMRVCEQMGDNEAIVLIGAEQFSTYRGYGPSFKFSGAHADETPHDCHPAVRLGTVISGIDALVCIGQPQFTVDAMRRELIKAYAGFSVEDAVLSQTYPAVATGNWGCGAFRGNLPLKAMLQWIAVTKSGRRMEYFTFGDERADPLEQCSEMLLERGTTVGELWCALRAYCAGGDKYKGRTDQDVFVFVDSYFFPSTTADKSAGAEQPVSPGSSADPSAPSTPVAAVTASIQSSLSLSPGGGGEASPPTPSEVAMEEEVEQKKPSKKQKQRSTTPVRRSPRRKI